MSYIGKVELKASDIKRDSGTIVGTPSTVTLNFTAANSNSLLFYLNGVKQSTSLYTIGGSPTVITLAAGTFTAADTWEAIGINDVGTTIVPADGTVTSVKIADDAVTTAKILDNNVTLAKMAGLARGKIIVGDASGDPSALTVGAADQVLTSDGTDASWVAAASPAGRNIIINGDFDVWQRGTSFSISGAGPGEYNADRWKFEGNNFTGSLIRQSFAANQTDVPDCPAYFVRWINNTTMPVGQKNQFLTPIELTPSGFKLANQEVTFSCWFKSASGTIPDGNVKLILESAVYPSIGAITTTWTKFTHTWTVWNSNQAYMWIGFEVPATYALLGGLDIAHCKLELGSVATTFEYKTLAQELQACKRYFQIPYNWWAHSDGGTATSWKFFHTFPVEMRAAPTLAASGSMLSNQMNNNANGPTLVTAPGTANKTGFQLSYTTVATGTGAAALLNYPYQGYGGFTADAEL